MIFVEVMGKKQFDAFFLFQIVKMVKAGVRADVIRAVRDKKTDP